MATRLYPSTTDRAVLARLADVPEETWERLDTLTQSGRDEKSGAALKAFHEGRTRDEEVSRLEDFLLYGWGRADGRALQRTGLDPVCDATQDLEQVQQLIAAHGIDLYDLELEALGGLDWS